MPVKKTVGSLIVFLAGALSGHAYYNDFQSYAENQALTSGNDWTGNSNWRVVTLDGNKVLQLAPGSGEQEVAYTGESFTGVGAGYTIQMRMRFDIGSGELSQYSGFRMDAPSSQPGAYNSRRFYFETTGYLGTGWNSVTGDGISFRQGCWYFLRVRRFGADSVTNNGGTLKIWASEFPITDNNAGTLIMNVTPPPDTDPQSAALGTFWLRGVAYGSDTVYVDELALSHGDTIMGGLLSYTEAPYDVCKANYLAANYMQALWDPVKKWLPFNEETYGDPVTRRGGYYYLEGQGRAINAFCHEADKGPVARLDLIADMAQGIINAAIPGSPGRHFYMVEGREALAYAANSDHFSLKWLQDASLEQYDVYVEKRPDSSSAWTLVDPASLTQTTTALDGGTRYTYTGSGVTVTLDSWCGVEDYAPVLTVATDSPCDVRLRLKNSASWANVADWTHFPVQSVITPSRTINSGSANAITGQLSVSLSTEEKRLLLRNDYKTYAARCPRSGWEAQANWQILDSYWLAAWDAAKAPDMVGTTSDERRIFTELALTWTGVTSVALRGAAYLEIDPNDNFFVTASADTVASGIAHNFGIKPYSPVRTSLLYAQTLGLCAAATSWPPTSLPLNDALDWAAATGLESWMNARAIWFAAADKWDEAMMSLEASLATHPGSFLALALQGLIQWKIRNDATAGRASLEAALVAHFDNSTACHLDTLLKEQGDHAARQQLLARWTDPADFRHGETEADVLLDTGKPQACLDLLESREWTRHHCRHRRTKLWVGAREALGLATTPVPASLGEDPYVVGR
jgi:hypothetical protein